jgi:hypothetical protein
VADSDAEELADLAAELHAELLSVDGTSVVPLPAEAAPEGPKGRADQRVSACRMTGLVRPGSRI